MGGFGETKWNGKVNHYTILLKLKETIEPYSENRMQRLQSRFISEKPTRIFQRMNLQRCVLYAIISLAVCYKTTIVSSISIQMKMDASISKDKEYSLLRRQMGVCFSLSPSVEYLVLSFVGFTFSLSLCQSSLSVDYLVLSIVGFTFILS